jgi:esterase
VTANEALELDHLRDAAALARVDVAQVVTPAHHDLVVGGTRLHYLDWGTSGSPPVLFLHGGALTARTWDLVCLAMRSDFHCLALDQRGHGDSEWSPSLDYSLEAHVGDVEGFIDALALSDPVVIGHSLGAFVGIELAARRPGALRALVLVDAAPGVSRDATKVVSEFILGPAEFDSVEECVVRARRFNPRRNERLLRRSLLHNLRVLPDGRWTWKYDRRHLSHDTVEQMRQRFNLLSDRLGAVECPTLVIRGADSEALSERDVARVVDQIPSAASVRIDGAGHTVQGDNPRDLTEALRTFLRAL